MFSEGSKTLEQVVQRSHRFPFSRGAQSQSGCSSEQLGLMEGVPAYVKGMIEPGDLRDSFQLSMTL